MPTAKTKKSVKKPGTSLARPGDPLVTGKGEVLEPENKPDKKMKKTVEAQTIEPAFYRPAKQRMLKELPAAPNVIKGIGAVFMYTLLGVGDREIADTLGTTVEYINELRHHSAYAECFQIVHGEFINANSELLTSRIASYAQSALTTVGDLAAHGKKEEVKLRASTDILDRAGVRPKDQDQRQAMTRTDLRIIVVDGNKSTDIHIDVMGE